MAPNLQRRDWQVDPKTTPGILSYSDGCKQPQYKLPCHGNRYIFDSHTVTSQARPQFYLYGTGSDYGFYPHLSYYGSTTMATVMGQHWSQRQRQEQQEHYWSSSSYCGSPMYRSHLNGNIAVYSDDKTSTTTTSTTRAKNGKWINRPNQVAWDADATLDPMCTATIATTIPLSPRPSLTFQTPVTPEPRKNVLDKHYHDSLVVDHKLTGQTNNSIPIDDVDGIVEAILHNPIFGVDGILKFDDRNVDSKLCITTTTDYSDTLNRLPNLKGEAPTAMVEADKPLDGHTLTRSQYPSTEETDNNFVDELLDLKDLSHPRKFSENPHSQTEAFSPLPGKVYRVLRRPLKEDSKAINPHERKVPRPEQEPSLSTIGKERQDSLNKSNTNAKISKKRPIFTYKTWDGSQKKWRNRKIFKAEVFKENECATSYHFRIPLSRGGELNIFPNLIDLERVNRVKKEILESKFWRRYSIQGGDEPRLHFLAHEDATDDFEGKSQPGYRYASITMKARPLSSVPKLQHLSNDLAKLRNIPNGKWNIGIHPVLYRDSKDSMGDHADDDQGETRILCILLDSPPTPRKVVVKVFDKLTGGKREMDRVHQDGDEFIELRLQPGDAYEMDGVMQESYSHCVPKDRDNVDDESFADKKNEKSRRICVVLRTGDQKNFEKDTGEACIDLAPRPPIKYVYGPIAELKEGNLYTRRELKRMNAFQLPQRGISGSHKTGADAIIVSGKRCGLDNIENLKYVAEWKIGASSLVTSFLKNTLIRVFRSSNYLHKYNLGASNMTLAGGRKCKTKTYRYDGLYRIVYIQPPTDPLGTFEFYLNRTLTFFHSKSSLEDAANELVQLSRKRVQAVEMGGNLRKRRKWAEEEIRAEDCSCCANLLLLHKETRVHI